MVWFLRYRDGEKMEEDLVVEALRGSGGMSYILCYLVIEFLAWTKEILKESFYARSLLSQFPQQDTNNYSGISKHFRLCH